MKWVFSDSRPPPIRLGLMGLDQAVARAESTIQTIDAALTKGGNPDLRKRLFLTDFLSDDFISAHAAIVETWRDRLENIEGLVQFEAGYDHAKKMSWKNKSTSLKKKEVETKKKWSRECLAKVGALERKMKGQKVKLKQSARESLDDCKAAAEELRDLYNERAKALKGPAVMKTVGKKRHNATKAKQKGQYAVLEHQINTDPDQLYLRDYIRNFERAFDHVQVSYMGGDTHVANQCQHLVKWGAQAVKKARNGGRKDQSFRILLALTLAAFRHTCWFESSEASPKELQALLELLGSEWRTLLAGNAWTQKGLRVRSNAVLQDVLERLEEAKEQVATCSRDLELGIRFNYMRNTATKQLMTKPRVMKQVFMKKTSAMKMVVKKKTKR